MSSEEKLLQELIKLHENSSLGFLLHADKKIHHLDSVKISKSPTPVTKPTLRGGVYFSDTHEYKITGIIDDQTTFHSTMMPAGRYEVKPPEKPKLPRGRYIARK